MKEVRAADTTFEQDYSLPFSLTKTIFFGGLLISFAFYYTFPVDKILHHYISTALKASPQCQLQFRNYEFGLFLPNIQFNEVAIPSGCVSPAQRNFIVDKMKVSFGGINFSPLGAVANLQLGVGKNIINLKASSDGKEHVVKLSEQKIFLDPLATLLSEKMGLTVPSLKGNAIINLHLKTKSQRLEIFDLKIKSKTFEFPAQSLMGFGIPELNMKNLDIVAKGKGKQVIIENLTAGNETSPLYLKTTGSLALNERIMNQSTVDLEVQLRFSEKLLEEYSFFKMVLSQFSTGDNNYKMKLTGPLSSPKPTPIR